MRQGNSEVSAGWPGVEGTLGQNRDMLDSHRWAPYPELTFQFFGEVVGQGQEGR